MLIASQKDPISTMAEEDKKPDQDVSDAAAEAKPVAPASDEPQVPLIKWKKVVDEGHAGAHGGAWKIALADMMTAMMAFFLLMWLLGATPEEQRQGCRRSSLFQVAFRPRFLSRRRQSLPSQPPGLLVPLGRGRWPAC